MSIMNRVEIYDSVVYDCFASIFRLNCNEKLISDLDKVDNNGAIKPNEEILKWVQETNNKIPEHIRKKIDKFFNWETFYGMCLVPMIHVYRPNNVNEFIDYLEKLSYEDILIRFLKSGYANGEEKLTVDKVKRFLNNEKETMEFIIDNLSIPSKDKWELLQFFMNPEQMKHELISLLRWYYDNIFKFEIENIKKITDKQIKDLKLKLNKYGEDYLKLLTYTEYKNDKGLSKIIISISYYYEFASLTGEYNNDDVYMIGYRYSEVSVEKKHALLSNIQMFKALADETRLNIIKLLSQRPWYGHELAKELKLSNSTISYHMSLLTANGFVVVERVDNKSYYTMDKKNIKKIICDSIDKMLA